MNKLACSAKFVETSLAGTHCTKKAPLKNASPHTRCPSLAVRTGQPQTLVEQLIAARTNGLLYVIQNRFGCTSLMSKALAEKIILFFDVYSPGHAICR